MTAMSFALAEHMVKWEISDKSKTADRRYFNEPEAPCQSQAALL